MPKSAMNISGQRDGRVMHFVHKTTSHCIILRDIES
ncbi:hypothetical protein CBM2629_B90092 [Cupriavidus taiwanensis]|nr:hypothetical protein CBM2629_B90092 [Cupriavidus taiwanensis]